MPRSSPPRTAYHHGDLRAALIAAATELVGRHGTEGFSLREAAARVGVSPSASYRHFADKADLLAAVAAQGFAALAEELDRAAARVRASATRRSLAVVEAQALAYVRFALAQPTQFQVMFGPYGAGSSRAVGGAAPSGRTAYQLMREALDDLVAEGVITRSARKDAELAVWSAAHGLTSILLNRLLAGSESIGVEAAVRGVIRPMLRGLVAAQA
jgi:AcrR family transcriptional regulator